MKPKQVMCALCAFVGVLILASTRFSAVSWLWKNWDWTWNYFQYSYQNGRGYQYRSDYSLMVVLTYLIAFVLGLIAHGATRKRVNSAWNNVAMILCVLGVISFAIEGSHWLWNHHLSWIAICPAASLILAVIVIFQLGGAGRTHAEQMDGAITQQSTPNSDC